MIDIGTYHTLEVVKKVDFGVYLDGNEAGEILLPARYVPEKCEPGDFIEVFLYLDNDERLIATTLRPYAKVGDFACLEVTDIGYPGAFLNWGLMKNLLVPFREQRTTLKVGDRPVVYIYLDEKSHRIAASAKIDKFTDKEKPELTEGEEVDLLIAQKTDLGYKVIVNNKYIGLIYDNEIFRVIQVGLKLKGFVKNIREDFKIDISLNGSGIERIDHFAELLSEKIKNSGGFLPLTDKSPADEIYTLLSMSKKNFKKAVGNLYKQRIINIEEDGIRMTDR